MSGVPGSPALLRNALITDRTTWRAHPHRHRHARRYTCTLAQAHACINSCKQTCAHLHAHTHADMHAHSQIHAHVHAERASPFIEIVSPRKTRGDAKSPLTTPAGSMHLSSNTLRVEGLPHAGTW